MDHVRHVMALGPDEPAQDGDEKGHAHLKEGVQGTDLFPVSQVKQDEPQDKDSDEQDVIVPTRNGQGGYHRGQDIEPQVFFLEAEGEYIDQKKVQKGNEYGTEHEPGIVNGNGIDRPQAGGQQAGRGVEHLLAQGIEDHTTGGKEQDLEDKDPEGVHAEQGVKAPYDRGIDRLLFFEPGRIALGSGDSPDMEGVGIEVGLEVHVHESGAVELIEIGSREGEGQGDKEGKAEPFPWKRRCRLLHQRGRGTRFFSFCAFFLQGSNRVPGGYGRVVVSTWHRGFVHPPP